MPKARPMTVAILAVLMRFNPTRAEATAAEAAPEAVLNEAVSWYTGTAGRIDERRAKELFLKAAETGKPRAEMWVARCYHRGRCGFPFRPDLGERMAKEVLGQIKALSDSADGQATFLLASAYTVGLCVDRDLASAAKLCLEAAKRGEPLVMHSLGLLYRDGPGVSRDDSQAVAWFRKAAKAGNVHALRRLAGMHSSGRGVPLDRAQAVKMWQEATSKGDTMAMVYSGNAYRRGGGVERDYGAARMGCAEGYGSGPGMDPEIG